MRAIFSLYVDIPNDDFTADRKTIIKDQLSKYQFQKNYERLVEKQRQYAKDIGVTYIHIGDSSSYRQLYKYWKAMFPFLSHFDIINFYKHYMMKEISTQYTNVCYFDLDIVPNTSANIFDAFPLDTFNVPDSNTDALWGKVNISNYNHDIRNPATKYWNAHAMLSHDDLPPDQNVYNTGIMLATSELINKLDYFGTFDNDLQIMTSLKNDPSSIYPEAIQRVFNYDNETLFSYKVIKNEIPITTLGNDWHCVLKDGMEAPPAKMYHVIDKQFQRFFK